MIREREPIFDSLPRSATMPAAHGEKSFDFLNRIAGAYWDHPRRLIQDWANELADPGDYYELRQRFRSRDDYEFRSAFLELYLHQCLLRAGYRVILHPEVPGTSRRPDFLAMREGNSLYIEAIAPAASPAAKAGAQREASLLDAVNRLGDPNFLLALHELQHGPAQPRPRLLRESLRGWLATLNPDDYIDFRSLSQHTWEDNGWRAHFEAIPIRPDKRGPKKNGRSIGYYGHHPVGWIDDAPAIQKALASKASAYGDLSEPFLIAVGTYIFDRDRWHSTNAMYGHLAVQLGRDGGGDTTRSVRRPDGYFGAPGRPQHQNVSGVLVVNQLMPEHFQRTEVTLWSHPQALHPLTGDPGFPGPTIEVIDGELREVPPMATATELFDLPDAWPPGEAFPDEEG